MIYQKINFKDHIDTKPDEYYIDGKKSTIKKITDGVTKVGTDLNAENLNHIENGIYQNSIDIANVNNTVINNKEEFDTFKQDIAKFDRKTYAELKTLKDSNQLQEGKRYILTDYRTKYEQPDTKVIKEMEIEELILTASSENTFEPIVYSPKYPQDIVYYDFDDNICEDKTTARNGFIVYREDTVKGNKCPQDFRTMLWARWKPDSKQYYLNDKLVNYEVWTSGNAKLNVIYKAGNKLLMAKNTKVPSNNQDTSVFETIYTDINVGLLTDDKTTIVSKVELRTSLKIALKKGALHEHLTFGENCENNVIGRVIDTLHNNVFIDTCKHNTLSTGSSNNTFNNACSNNSFGSRCIGNILSDNSVNNSFGNRCKNNILMKSCSNNIFGNSCLSNILSVGCFNNSFGSACNYINYGFFCRYNEMRNGCDNIYIGDNGVSNTFHPYCTHALFPSSSQYLMVKRVRYKDFSELSLIKDKEYNITIESKENDRPIMWYVDFDNKPIYKSIP